MKLLAIDDTAKDFYLCAPQLTRGVKRTRACSAAKISRYLARCEGMHGIKKARQALRHVLDNAASVREAATAMKLTLPSTSISSPSRTTR